MAQKGENPKEEMDHQVFIRTSLKCYNLKPDVSDAIFETYLNGGDSSVSNDTLVCPKHKASVRQVIFAAILVPSMTLRQRAPIARMTNGRLDRILS